MATVYLPQDQQLGATQPHVKSDGATLRPLLGMIDEHPSIFLALISAQLAVHLALCGSDKALFIGNAYRIRMDKPQAVTQNSETPKCVTFNPYANIFDQILNSTTCFSYTFRRAMKVARAYSSDSLTLTPNFSCQRAGAVSPD